MLFKMLPSTEHKNRTTLDYLLYIMAGAVILTLCFSTLLWLTF